MSENVDYNELHQNKDAGQKLSVMSELSGASIGIGIALIAIIIVSLAFYVFMNLSPKKSVKVVDDAGIFTSDELERITDAAEMLSKKKDINVVVVTTRDKGAGYTNEDDDEVRFAEDFYNDSITSVPLQNNSGVCILIDLTLDYDGGRFFWLYTYGTAHFAVDDDDCYSIFRNNLDLLSFGQYGAAVENIIAKLNDFSYKSYGAIVIFTMVIPVVLALFIANVATPKRKLDPRPPMYTYGTPINRMIKKVDTYKNKRVIHHESSSSGGGFFGGGGGGSSGGGGGGFSGGGFSGGGGGGFSGGGGGRF